MEFVETPKGNVFLISEAEDGRIVQLGVTPEQNTMIQMFLSSISKDAPFLRLGADFDLA